MGEKWFAGKVSVPDEGFTHGGKFHADDVFSTAFLRLLNPDMKITRGFEVPSSFSGIVYDIGRGCFDHHQEGKEVRDNGCPYAAFGLLWREYAPSCVGDEEAKRFDECFVQPLDESDNTGCPNALAEVIDEFNPVWDSEESYDACFYKAVDFAEQILQNHFQSLAGIERAKNLVVQAMQDCDGEILILPQYVPWKDAVVDSGYQLVVYPSNRGGYSVQGVPVCKGSNELVCAMPQEWRGKDASELPKISGIATLRFCHASGFMAAAETEEDAVLAAKKALQSTRPV